MHWLTRFNNKRGQYILEYSTLILLVIATTIIMYPYAVRSWNAYIKGYEDAVDDSLNDPLKRAGDTPRIANCECEWVTPPSCDIEAEGDPCCGRGCPPTETSKIYICHPIGCSDDNPEGWRDGSIQCVANNECCSDWDRQEVPSFCGADAADHPDCGACPEGEVCETRHCGPGIEYQCVPDPNCDAKCIGSYPLGFEYGPACPDDTQDVPVNMAWTFVGADECSLTKCEGQCAETFIPAPDGSTCECPEGQAVVNERCETPSTLYVCPYDTTHHGGAWATWGCLGQISSINTCKNYTHHDQWFTAECTPVSDSTNYYECPYDTTHSGGAWATWGCLGQISSVNFCRNYTHHNKWHTVTCPPISFDPNAPSGTFSCPYDLKHSGGAWATWGCLGQVSSIHVCRNYTHHNQWYTTSCPAL